MIGWVAPCAMRRMVPVWEVLEFKWLRHHSPSYARNRNMLRAAVVFGTGLVACAIPNFGLFVSLIGNRFVFATRTMLTLTIPLLLLLLRLFRLGGGLFHPVTLSPVCLHLWYISHDVWNSAEHQSSVRKSSRRNVEDARSPGERCFGILEVAKKLGV